MPTGDALALAVTGGLSAALALFLRLFIHIGKTPSGVDTWYFLTYARELRRTWRMPVRLQTYLLQDEEQSYPPLFPIFLALLPGRLLERYYWLVSPITDCVHLLFLHFVAYKISASVPAATVASLIYAVTPQLVSETRSLNSRAFGALMQSIAFMALFRFVVGGEVWPWLPAALVLATGVFLSHSLTAISFGVTCVVLSVALQDARFLLVALAAPVLAVAVTRGLYVRGVLGHLQSARFWRRRRYQKQANQVFDSPLYGTASGSAATEPQSTSPSRLTAVRLIGENPFILSVLGAVVLGYLPIFWEPWSAMMFWWTIGVFGWAILTTFAPVLRVFGPGYLYIKTSTFPTAYTLGALVIGSTAQFNPLSAGVALTLPAFAASLAGLAYFYRYIHTRRTEHTATAPPGLQAATQYLASLDCERFACLPTMYADYIAYHTGKQVLWGGHSGDPERLDGFYPVITRPLEQFFQQYQIEYFILDLDYARLDRLRLSRYVTPACKFDRFEVFRVTLPPAGDQPFVP